MDPAPVYEYKSKAQIVVGGVRGECCSFIGLEGVC